MRLNGIEPTEGYHAWNVVAVVLRCQRPNFSITSNYLEQEESFRFNFSLIGFQALPRRVVLVLFL